ncbi:MAG: NPCBM/NEW2 domain-containing protein [Planctomycetales bacterium]|nr:NPCBM/NEW2 domain-containing protein [Planctomycetales bacterium]
MPTRTSRWLVFAATACLIVCPIACARANDPPPTLVLVGGERIAATFVNLHAPTEATPSGELELTGADGKKFRKPLEAIVSWGVRRDFESQPQFLLRDGGVIVAELLGTDSGVWRIGADTTSFASRQPIWTSAELPIAALAGAIFAGPDDPAARDRLAAQLRRSSESDRDEVWMDQGNIVRGELTLAPVAQNPAGAFDQPARGLPPWRLKVRQREVEVAHDRVRAIRLRPRAPQADVKARMLLGFVDGSLLAVTDASPQDDAIKLSLAGGGEAKLPRQTFLESLCLVRPLHDRVAYLADREPAEQRHLPYLSVQRAAQRNHNALGGLPRWNGQIYSKALGVCSQSFVVYSLDSLGSPDSASSPDRKWERLSADVAIDRAAGSGGAVTFRIFLETPDGWEVAAESGAVRGGDPPTPISASLRGANRVALVVDYGERLDVLDYANWLNLRVEAPPP